MRIISHYDIPIRSWVVDVAPIFHPADEWNEMVQQYQTPGIGEELLKTRKELPPDDLKSMPNILQQIFVPKELAFKIGKSFNETMVKAY